MYKSIRIQNFRGIKDLKINDLGRVNLIVGANNVGKSSVLEALALLHMHRDGYELGTILRSRGYEPDSATDGAFSTMFYARQLDPFEVIAFDEAGNQTAQVIGVQAYGPSIPTNKVLLWKFAQLSIQESIQLYYPGGIDVLGGRSQESLVLDLRTTRPFPSDSINGPWGPVSYLPSSATYSTNGLARLLTQVEFRGATREMVAVLETFDERIVDVFNGLDMINANQTTVNITVQIAKDKRLGLPLGASGEGTKRLFEMLLLLPLASGGIALIDEVEQGVYHGNLSKMWKTMDDLSSANDVQIFATTHSWECVTAAVETFRSNPEDFRMFRLSREGGELHAVPYDHGVALAATTGFVEVR